MPTEWTTSTSTFTFNTIYDTSLYGSGYSTIDKNYRETPGCNCSKCRKIRDREKTKNFKNFKSKNKNVMKVVL